MKCNKRIYDKKLNPKCSWYTMIPNKNIGCIFKCLFQRIMYKSEFCFKNYVSNSLKPFLVLVVYSTIENNILLIDNNAQWIIDRRKYKLRMNYTFNIHGHWSSAFNGLSLQTFIGWRFCTFHVLLWCSSLADFSKQSWKIS